MASALNVAPPAPWPAPPYAASAIAPTRISTRGRSGVPTDHSRRGTPSLLVPPSRHGSVSRFTRDRSRDGQGSGPILINRAQPGGEQEEADWLQALDITQNAVETTARANRGMAGNMATANEQIQALHLRLTNLENLGIGDQLARITEGLSHTTQKATLTETHLIEACGNIVSRYVTHENMSDAIFMLEARLASAVEMIETLQINHRAQQFSVATPIEPPPGAEEDPLQSNDAWAPPGTDIPGNHGDRYARWESMQPLHHDNGLRPSSPFRGDRQPAPPGIASGLPSQHAPGGQPLPARPATFQPLPTEGPESSPFDPRFQSPVGRLNHPNRIEHGEHREFMGNQKGMNRENKAMSKFSGNPGDFKDWAAHFVDHMAMVHIGWRSTLHWFSNTREDLSWSRLNRESMGPNNESAAELAVKLEQTIANWLPLSLYNKRIQLCGGRSEFGNGFRMWRRLHEDNVGSGDIIEFAGTEALRDYGKCEKISDVMGHVDGWVEALDTHGGELDQAPKMVRSMLLNIIPKELKSEILKERALAGAGHLQIIEWMRARCMILQQENLAEVTKRSLTQRNRKLHAVQQQACDTPVPEDDNEAQAPAWVKQLIAAVKPSAHAPPAPHAASRAPRGRESDRGNRGDKRRGDSRSPRGSPRRSPSPGRLIDWGRKCFHCGSEDHTRNDCKEFNSMMSKHNKGTEKSLWKPPPGYKSALAKARDIAKAKAKSDQPKIAAVTAHNNDQDDDTGSEDNYSVVDGRRSFKICALRDRALHQAPITSVNRYDGLRDDQSEYDPGVLQALSSWAHKVEVQSKSPKNREKTKLDRTVNYINGPKRPTDDASVMILNDHVSDKDIRKAQEIAPALPEDRKGFLKAVKKVSKIECKSDEIVAIMDTGSFTHALNARELLPDHQIEEVDDEMKGKVAETACGGILKVLGSVTVHGMAGDKSVQIRFNDMDVQCPILSVRRLCTDGHDVYLNKAGGYIENLVNGQRIPFFEHQGVYYLKLKIVPPPPTSPPKAPFQRHGA